MVKKITLIVLSLAIVTTGVVGFSKLNYWQRSISIFKYDSSAQQSGRGGRGYGMEGMRHPEGTRERMARELPDSIRQRFEREGRPLMREGRERPDTLFRGRGGDVRSFSGNGGFEGGMRRGEGRGGRGREEVDKVNLGTAGWFLAVFASLVVIVFYIEKGVKLIKKKK